MTREEENEAIVNWLLKRGYWNDCGKHSNNPSYINLEFNIDSPDGDLREAILREIKDG